jgi:4a-hydroxytetrahydrobiopterin dehydratase
MTGMKYFFGLEYIQGVDLNDLKQQHCKPCEGGVCPLDESHSTQQLELVPGWEITGDGKSIVRKLKFKSFSDTMSFINAMAYMAEQQGHHPDFSAGYGYCEVRYTTHAIGGLSENDFICAARINDLLGG